MIVILFLACAAKQNAINATPPAWIMNIPLEDSKIYAVGSCGRTFVPEDAWKNAANDARGELATNLQARVQGAFLLVKRSGGGGFVDQAYIVDATAVATDTVMEESQIVSIWFDENGVVPGGNQGTTYALAVMAVSKATSAIKTKIENVVSEEDSKKILNAISKE